VATKPATAFALGAVYGRYDILVEALEHFGDGTNEGESRILYFSGEGTSYHHLIGYTAGSEGYVTLRQVPDELRRRIPLNILWKYQELQETIMVLRRGTWKILPSMVSWDVSLDPVRPTLLVSRFADIDGCPDINNFQDGRYGFGFR
jgi:hypothetical protein